MPSSYYICEQTVTDPMGHPVSGVRIWLCQQPATIGRNGQVPSPLQQVYADPLGNTPLDQLSAGGVNPSNPGGPALPSQQLITDQNGYCAFYASKGTYTLVFYSTQFATPSQQLVLTDQVILSTGGFVSDTTGQGITPIGDAGTGFQLSAVPNPPASLVLAINGLIVTSYALSGSTVVLETPLQPADYLTATYQTF
jgi:hypothetical protein